MKNVLMAGMISLVMMSAAPAMALLLTADGIDVGAVDSLLFSDQLGNSSEQEELDWVNDILGLSGDDRYLSFIKEENNEDDPWVWHPTNVSGVFAYELQSTPIHFLIKTGTIKVDGKKTDTHFLYSNEAGMGWAVIDLSELGLTDLTNITKLSHIDEFGSAPVPEPATMFLFGTGLLGLAGFRLRKKQK